MTRTCINGDRSISNFFFFFLDRRSLLCANTFQCVSVILPYYRILAASQQQRNHSDALDKSALNVPFSIFHTLKSETVHPIHRNRNVRARAVSICSSVSKHVTFHLN